MNGLTVVGGLIVALVGQWLKRYKSVPTVAVQLAMLTIGIGLYGVGNGFPSGREQFVRWFDLAVIWALAIPGAASMIGTHPSMKTDSV